MEPLVTGMGTLSDGGISFDDTIAAWSSLEAITAANGSNSKRETFWNGSRDAGFLAIEQQLKSKLARILQSGREEGWAFSACLLSRGQQL